MQELVSNPPWPFLEWMAFYPQWDYYMLHAKPLLWSDIALTKIINYAHHNRNMDFNNG